MTILTVASGGSLQGSKGADRSSEMEENVDIHTEA